jgi:phage repressor protein C with HTH and peptisase S24 domain
MDAKAIIDRMKKALNAPTYAKLAEILGVKLSSLDSWKSRNNVPEKHILKCVLLTNKPREWFIDGREIKNIQEDMQMSDTDNVSIPIIYAGAGAGIYNYESQDTLITLNTSIFKDLKGKTLLAVEVIGDSMQPALSQGDYIIVAPIQPTRSKEDGIYAIRFDGTIKIKALQFKLDGSIDIISYNQAYKTETFNPSESQIDFEIIGKKVLQISR